MRLIVTKLNLGLWAAAYIQQKCAAFAPAPGKPFVLGLPTGGTVIDMYANLRLFYKAGKLDFSHIITFNMDEYVALPKDHPQSYHSYMQTNLFNAVNIRPENIHIPDGNAPDLQAECTAYEHALRDAGGVNLFIGGVGRNGHLAFNEPGSAFDSRTREVELTPSTIEANARFFLNDPNKVPRRALTIGLGTLLDADEILILANGTHKADALRKLAEMQPTTDCPLTVLRNHSNASVLADEDACSLLDDSLRHQIRARQAEQPQADGWIIKI